MQILLKLVRLWIVNVALIVMLLPAQISSDTTNCTFHT